MWVPPWTVPLQPFSQSPLPRPFPPPLQLILVPIPPFLVTCSYALEDLTNLEHPKHNGLFPDPPLPCPSIQWCLAAGLYPIQWATLVTLTLAMVGVFTPQRLANTVHQALAEDGNLLPNISLQLILTPPAPKSPDKLFIQLVVCVGLPSFQSSSLKNSLVFHFQFLAQESFPPPLFLISLNTPSELSLHIGP